MPDLVLAPRSGFADLLHDHGISPAGITVTDRDGLGIASVIAFSGSGTALAERAATDFGIDLPEGPRRAVAGDVAFIGTGPGRWLALADTGGNGFAAGLAASLHGLAAVADQSNGYAVVRLTGPHLRAVLAKGVNLDLHPTAFPVGAAAATAIAHIGVILWRLPDAGDGAPVFEIALFRSMAGSFWHWLRASAGAYGLAIVAAGAG